MGIKIGDKNKIKNSIVTENGNVHKDTQKKGFVERHPIFIGLIISLIAGFILMFSFWKDIIGWLENLF